MHGYSFLPLQELLFFEPYNYLGVELLKYILITRVVDTILLYQRVSYRKCQYAWQRVGRTLHTLYVCLHQKFKATMNMVMLSKSADNSYVVGRRNRLRNI